MHEFESMVMSQDKDITVLTWNYFTDRNDIKSYILRKTPWHNNNDIGIIAYISDLAEVNIKTDWLSLLLPRTQAKLFDIELVNNSCINPQPHLTENEWTAAWLAICGLSLRGGLISLIRRDNLLI